MSEDNLEVVLLKEEIKKLKKEFVKFKTDAECKLKANEIDICNLENKLVESNKQFERFKKTYARDKYDMKLDIRTNLHKALTEDKYAEALKNWYLLATGKILNLEEPKTYNEKIQWLKLYDKNPMKTKLTDKYLVRDWVSEQIGEQYLIKLLGAWETFDDIDFSTLPDKFVLKANHGCGYNLIVTNKSEMNLKEAKEKFDRWMTINFAYVNLEMHYKDIKPMIIAEEYLENADDDLYDYKVWCFNGEPKYIMYLANRKNGLKMAFYDTEWKKMPFTYSVDVYEDDVPRPDNLDELLEISKKLSKDFNHVRVDFYRLNDGSYKFGEMTFTSAGGKAIWRPEEYDQIIGDMFEVK